jgi:hypothetical protein
VDKLFLGPYDTDFCPCCAKFVHHDEEGWVVVNRNSSDTLVVDCTLVNSSSSFAHCVDRLWFILNSPSAVFMDLCIISI